MSATLGAGEGGMEGQATPFFIFIILSTPPARQGCLFMGHICWLAGDMSLVRKNAWESPRSQESRAHSFRLAFTLAQMVLWLSPPTCDLSPISCQLRAHRGGHAAHLEIPATPFAHPDLVDSSSLYTAHVYAFYLNRPCSL